MLHKLHAVAHLDAEGIKSARTRDTYLINGQTPVFAGKAAQQFIDLQILRCQ